MGDPFSRLVGQAGGFLRRPLELWNPPFSGDLDMRIAADGSWHYQGSRIERESLLHLFASILRFEPNVGHVLVTPLEKWRIQVEDAPLIAVAADITDGRVRLATNVGHDFDLGPEHPLEIRQGKVGPVPRVMVERGLWARLSRPVYYELAERAETRNGVTGISSHGRFFPLQ